MAIRAHPTIQIIIAKSNRLWSRCRPLRSFRYLRDENTRIPPSMPFMRSNSSSLSFHKSRCLLSRRITCKRNRFATAKMKLPAKIRASSLIPGGTMRRNATAANAGRLSRKLTCAPCHRRCASVFRTLQTPLNARPDVMGLGVGFSPSAASVATVTSCSLLPQDGLK